VTVSQGHDVRYALAPEGGYRTASAPSGGVPNTSASGRGWLFAPQVKAETALLAECGRSLLLARYQALRSEQVFVRTPRPRLRMQPRCSLDGARKGG